MRLMQKHIPDNNFKSIRHTGLYGTPGEHEGSALWSLPATLKVYLYMYMP